MAIVSASQMLEKLEETKSDYLAAVANIEDGNLDEQTRMRAASMIQETQIQSEIALEQIQN